MFLVSHTQRIENIDLVHKEKSTFECQNCDVYVNSSYKFKQHLVNVHKPEILYKEANVFLEDMNYLKALGNFNEISDKFPLSNEGVQSQLMIAFIKYLELDYDYTRYISVDKPDF